MKVAIHKKVMVIFAALALVLGITLAIVPKANAAEVSVTFQGTTCSVVTISELASGNLTCPFQIRHVTQLPYGTIYYGPWVSKNQISTTSNGGSTWWIEAYPGTRITPVYDTIS